MEVTGSTRIPEGILTMVLSNGLTLVGITRETGGEELAVFNPRIWMLHDNNKKMTLSFMPGNPPVAYVRPSVYWPVPEWDRALYDLYLQATSPETVEKAKMGPQEN